MAMEQRAVAYPSADLPAAADAVIHVFATSEQGTLAALQQAAAAATSRHAKVVVLVPTMVGYGLPLRSSNDEVDALTASYRDLAARVGLDVAVRICPCRDAAHVSARLMLTGARIILGGRRRHWPATAEQQLARQLACEGHHGTFVDIETGRPYDEGAALA
jgi:imidazolonepropionase-like amidohydrolase